MNLKVKFQYLCIFAITASLISIGFTPDAYAAIPTVISAEITGGNTITIVYSEPVITTIVNYLDLQLTGAGLRVPVLVQGSGTDTITVTFAGTPVGPDETGTIDIVGIVLSLDFPIPLPLVVPLNDLPLLDGQIGLGSGPSVSEVTDSIKDITGKFRNLVPSTISLSNVNIFSEGDSTTPSFTTKIDTNYVRVNEPTSLALEFPEYAVGFMNEIRLYLNLNGANYKINESDTYVIYDKYNPLIIEDPHGFFSDVDVTIGQTAENVNYKFELTFAKEMEESNMIVQYIDRVRNERTFEFADAIHVVGTDFVEKVPSSTEALVQKNLNRYEKVMNDNLEQGINVNGITKDELTNKAWHTLIRTEEAIQKSDTISSNTIPSGIKKEVYQWANGMMPEKEFEKTIQYLIANDYIDQPESEFLAFGNEIPDWMVENNNWWSLPVVSDVQFLNGVKSLLKNTLDDIPSLEQVSLPETISGLNKKLEELKSFQNKDWNKWNVNGITLDPKVYLLLHSQTPAIDASSLGLLYEDGKTNLILETSQIDEDSLENIRNLGNISIESDQYIQITMNYQDLSTLYSIDGITKIRAPFIPTQYEFPNYNLEIVNVNDEFISENSGKNIKVAVIDMAFDLDNQKISSNVADSKSFRYNTGNSAIALNGLGSEKIHGTAVAELVVDTAPDSNLFLYTMGNDLEFVAALNEAIQNEVDVVVIPLGWPNLPTDGTSHITKVVSEFSESGIITILPAGNYGQRHWENSFVDSNENGWNEFDGVDEGLSFMVTQERIQNNIPIKINLLWENNNDVYDFDMVLLDSTNNIVEYSANIQSTENDDAFEQIIYYPKEAGTYAIGILYDGTELPNSNLEIFSLNDELEHVTVQGSVTVPTDANGVIVTGAVDPVTNNVALFSSQGPTNNGYSVPHVLAPGSANTIVTGDKPFQGTSASVPYLGGVVARMLEVNQDLTTSEILELIQTHLAS